MPTDPLEIPLGPGSEAASLAGLREAGNHMPARDGDTVSVHYVISLEGGEVYESSRDRAPLLLTIGSGDALPGFEDAIVGLEPGMGARIHLTPERAYGLRYEEAVEEVPIDLFGEGGAGVGDVASIIADDGSRMACRVTAVSDDLMTVTVDFNHPLAGKPIDVDIELVEIVSEE
jgi:peptidylprolyl isomerase